jgi:tetratricopeptide (TPR) repeat protein
VLLHVGVVLMLWRVLVAMGIRGSVWGALLFAVHPVNVEAVAWIFQQKTLLAALLALSSLFVYLGATDAQRKYRPGRILVSLSLFILAMLAKASVAPWPVTMLIARAWRDKRRPTWADLAATLPFWIAAAGLAAANLAWYAQPGVPEAASELIRDDGWLSRAAIGGKAFWFYLGKALVPIDLSFVYPRWHVVDPPDALALIPLAALIVALAVTIYVARRRAAWRAVAATFGDELALLLPVLGIAEIYFMRYSFVADHWHYLGLMGLCALGAALSRWRPLALAVTVAFAATAIMRVRIFHDENTVWRDAIAKNPESWMPHNALGLNLKKSGDLTGAEAEYRAALALKPQAETYYNLAHLLEGTPRFAEARPLYEESARLNPYQARIFINLGAIQARLGDPAAARASFARALTLEDSAMGHYDLGFLLESAGDRAGALAEYERATQLDPSLGPAAEGLARVRSPR